MAKSQLKSGIYLSYISLLVTNLTNLFLTPFLIKSLGSSEYGLYILIGAFVGYIAVLDFGLSNTTIRFISKFRAESKKEEEENFIFLTLIIYSLISFAVLILGSLIYINLELIFGNSLTGEEIEIAKVMFIILVISLSFTLPMNLFRGIITAYEKFVFPRLLTIIRALVRVLAIVILLNLNYNVITVVLVDAILNVIMMFSMIFYALRKLNVKIKFYDLNSNLIKEIFSYSSLIFISVIVDQIYWRIGHLILGVMASTSEVAIFAVGMLIGQYFIAFSTAISSVFLPKITKMVVLETTGEELTNLMIKTGRLQFIVIGLVLSNFILFGKDFIYLWVGSEFMEAWYITLVIVIPLSVVLTQTIGITILQAKNMHGYRAIIYLCISIVNVVISIYLTKWYGIIGTALGTTLSLTIGNIIAMNIFYQFKVKLNMLLFYRKVFGYLLISMIIATFIGHLLSWINYISWTGLILKGTIFSVVYLAILWKLGMNSYEKELFKNESNKLIVLFKKVIPMKNL
ncbi:hypothetical protein AUC31_14975 [Planococcus rifietoensis]|uniref:Uncharacterized protein n=1 Tax=Planococcus rifietoensis TaxID=200991 RepID=A0A0U2QB65_9BACL|nr:oligosaccharide flippase family protein [Planococcus rifietoensis]ALS76422.1 hypothetical protein AUC31_14975 [Planococcus rifietoensis]